MKVCVFQHEDKSYSAVTPIGLLADRQPRDVVKQLILTTIKGVTSQEVEQWLWNPATAQEYRGAWATAVAASVGTIEAAISGLEQSEETEKLRQQLGNVASQVETLFEEVKLDRKRAKLAAKEKEMSKWVANMRQTLVADGLYETDRSIQAFADQSELAQEIAALRREVA